MKVRVWKDMPSKFWLVSGVSAPSPCSRVTSVFLSDVRFTVKGSEAWAEGDIVSVELLPGVLLKPTEEVRNDPQLPLEYFEPLTLKKRDGFYIFRSDTEESVKIFEAQSAVFGPNGALVLDPY